LLCTLNDREISMEGKVSMSWCDTSKKKKSCKLSYSVFPSLKIKVGMSVLILVLTNIWQFLSW